MPLRCAGRSAACAGAVVPRRARPGLGLRALCRAALPGLFTYCAHATQDERNTEKQGAGAPNAVRGLGLLRVALLGGGGAGRAKHGPTCRQPS